MKKRLAALALCAGIVAMIVLSVLVVRTVRAHQRKMAMLEAVDIPIHTPLRAAGYVHWTDYLMYVSGYDILVAKVNPEGFAIPETWHAGTTTIDAIEAECDIDMVESWFQEQKMTLPPCFDAWYFRETGRGGETYRDWQYYVGLYSADGTLIVYHGHDLWGLDDYERFKDTEQKNKTN